MWPPEEIKNECPIIDRLDDPQTLLAFIIESLDSKDSLTLKTCILEHKLKEQSIMWELILKIGECITADNHDKHPYFFDICTRCMNYLTKTGNPKETFLAILEQMDTFIDDIKYKTFLPMIQTILLKIPSKLFHSLDIALETVSSHIRGINLPENVQLEGKEVKAFHLDEVVIRLTDILGVYLNFLETFTKEAVVESDQATAQSVSDRQMNFVVKKHLLKVLDHPLCHLVLTFDSSTDRVKSNSRLCAEKAMILLTQVETDFYRLLQNVPAPTNSSQDEDREITTACDKEEVDNRENEKREEDNKTFPTALKDVENWDLKLDMTPLGQACLIYLIHVEHLGIDKFPHIYRHEHILETHLGCVSLLLQNTTYAINFKGLLLCRALTGLLTTNSLTVDSLDNPGYLRVLNDLIHVVVKCPVSDHRSLATEIFPALIGKFEAGGRSQLYCSVLSSCSHSSLKGYLITLLKNDISKHLKFLKLDQNQQINNDTMTMNIESTCHESDRGNIPGSVKASQLFTGKNLHRLLLLAIKLPEGETTDMLENSNQIISALNLLRFLVLADPKKTNLTRVWDDMIAVQSVFTSPLQRGLDLSKAHYKLELESVLEGRSGFGATSTPEMNVAVSGARVPQLEKSERIDLIYKAINTHDIMLSLLARLTEIIDQQ